MTREKAYLARLHGGPGTPALTTDGREKPVAWALLCVSCDEEALLATPMAPQQSPGRQKDRKHIHDPQSDKNKRRHTLLTRDPLPSALETVMSVSQQLRPWPQVTHYAACRAHQQSPRHVASPSHRH